MRRHHNMRKKPTEREIKVAVKYILNQTGVLSSREINLRCASIIRRSSEYPQWSRLTPHEWHNVINHIALAYPYLSNAQRKMIYSNDYHTLGTEIRNLTVQNRVDTVYYKFLVCKYNFNRHAVKTLLDAIVLSGARSVTATIITLLACESYGMQPNGVRDLTETAAYKLLTDVLQHHACELVVGVGK